MGREIDTRDPQTDACWASLQSEKLPWMTFKRGLWLCRNEPLMALTMFILRNENSRLWWTCKLNWKRKSCSRRSQIQIKQTSCQISQPNTNCNTRENQRISRLKRPPKIIRPSLIHSSKIARPNWEWQQIPPKNSNPIWNFKVKSATNRQSSSISSLLTNFAYTRSIRATVMILWSSTIWIKDCRLKFPTSPTKTSLERKQTRQVNRRKATTKLEIKRLWKKSCTNLLSIKRSLTGSSKSIATSKTRWS